MNYKNQKGFTLIEVIVVAGIIAILAGILVPMIFNQIDESKKTRAAADCKSISTAILAFRKDVGRWPNMKTATSNFTFLYGPGYVPATHDSQLTTGTGYDVAEASTLKDHLTANDPGYLATMWKGPYMSDIQADPWGNPYVVDASGFFMIDPVTSNPVDDPTTPVWVLSAGPNGIFETNRGSNALDTTKDDIGIRIK